MYKVLQDLTRHSFCRSNWRMAAILPVIILAVAILAGCRSTGKPGAQAKIKTTTHNTASSISVNLSNVQIAQKGTAS